MADEFIARRAWVLFEANRLGGVACFSLEELEALLRSSHARGQLDVAKRCADTILAASADSQSVDLAAIADQFSCWASEATVQERRWR